MTLSDDELAELADLACRAAREAGRLIGTSRPQRVESKPGGESAASQVVTDVDRQAEKRILQILTPSAARLDFAVLSEEQPDDKRRLSTSHFWSIDPLDGTLPFVEGNAGYAVSIALVTRAGVPRLGVVYDPVRKVLYQAIDGSGFRREPALGLPIASSQRLSVFADRSFRTSPHRDQLIAILSSVATERRLAGIDLRIGFGAVMNACAVFETPPACYVKLPKPKRGGGSLWDFAATACLLREAGGVASDIDGDPLDLNRADSTFMNHRGVLYVSDPALAAHLVGAIREGCRDFD